MERVARQRYRAELTPVQQHYTNALLGAGRATYNSFLWEAEQEYQRKQKAEQYGFPFKTRMGSTVSKVSAFNKQPEERQWLRKFPAWTVQQAALEAKKAFEKWWNPELQHKKPRFKRKRGKAGVQFERPKTGFKVEKLNKNHSQVWLGKKVGWVKFRDSREEPPVDTSGVSLIREPSGKHYLSFVVQQEIADPKVNDDTDFSSVDAVSADLGVVDLVVWINTHGERGKVPAPREYRRAEIKLKKLGRSYSKKNKGSKNQEKARLKLAQAHEAVRLVRQDQQRKIASKLAIENQVVCLETLSAAGMKRNRRLSKSVSDAAFGSLVEAVKNACEKSGTLLLQADRWAATTKVCSQCGCVREDALSLSVRVWQCEDCDAWLDRDWNAAVNVMLAAGMAERVNACGERLRELALADTPFLVETGTHQ